MSEPAQKLTEPLAETDFSLRNLALLAVLTAYAFLLMGYHPGLEDDSFYLAAIKKHLNPALFPFDSDYFRVQFQATIFDKLIAFSVRLFHLPVPWTVLLWQIAAIFLVLLGVYRLSRRCFPAPEGYWSATTLIAALLTLPIPGIAILLADQYLHPRTLATGAILFAMVSVIDRKLWLAGLLLLVAFALHAIMACLGVSFCAFLWWRLRNPQVQAASPEVLLLLLFPLGWIFEPASDAWRQAAATRAFYFLGQWRWYEWFGVFAPLAILYALRRFLHFRQDRKSNLISVISALLYFSIFQLLAGLMVMLPPRLERLRPFEPMRYLHLLYLIFFIIVGGLLGTYFLKRRVYRWVLLFVPLTAGMFYAQRSMYAASPHLELPFVAASNPWLKAFDWIRQHTPVDASFALDPHYQTLPGEDSHGFRALAERSVLADYEKDGGMAARVPSLAPRWLREVTTLNGWKNFQGGDFQRLRNDFGVSWVVLSRADAQFSNPDSAFMICPYANTDVKVCRLN
jgi:hypothetical protein